VKLILIIVFAVFAYVNYRHLNIGFLSLVEIDEYAFHHSLLNMFEGVIELNLKKLFSFYLYSYGFIFFLINLIFTFLFFLFDNTEMTIYFPRIVSTLFAVGSLYIIYIFASNRSSKLVSHLIVLFVLTMPGFWRNAFWFHPDWMMTFFILLSIYFYSKDNFNYKKYFWYGTLSFGFAISSKIQAITFYPFLFFYIFYENFNLKNFCNFKSKVILLIKSTIFTIIIFILTNPYILHPLGFEAWSVDFAGNMKSNNTNHGSSEILKWNEKITNPINAYYFTFTIFVILALLIIFNSFKYFFYKKKDILNVISLYVLINLIYLIFFVNKAWQHYYLSVLIASSLLFIIHSKKMQKFILPLFIIINFTLSFEQHKKIFFYNPITVQHLQMSQSLVDIFSGKVDKNTNILIDAYVPFDFKSLDIGYKNIHIIYGALSIKNFIKDEFYKVYPSFLSFPERNFIVIKKSSLYFYPDKFNSRADKNEYQKAYNIIQNFNSNGDFGYEKFAENDYFFIWRKKR
jgi:4-amino-4-deoxy-L-arabinose transferase-like glycosyltransferase